MRYVEELRNCITTHDSAELEKHYNILYKNINKLWRLKEKLWRFRKVFTDDNEREIWNWRIRVRGWWRVH